MSPAVMSSPLRAELKALLQLALPLAAAQAGQALMGLVDTAVTGRVSAAAQAAAGLGNSLTFTVSFLGMGLMLALDPLVAWAVGQRREAEARGWYWQGIWLALIAATLLLGPLVAATGLLEAFGATAEVASGATRYVLWRLPGVYGLLLFVGARSYLQGVGKPRPIFVAMLVANVVNLVLDLALVFGVGPVPPLGATGAALATTLSTFVQWGVLVAAIARTPVSGAVARRPSAEKLREAARLGTPIGLHLIVEAGVFALAGLLAAGLGDAAAAAHQSALQWASVTFCVTVGIGSAGTTRVGWAIGAGDAAAARRAGLVAFGAAAAFMASAALGFLLAPGPFARLMTASEDVVPVATALMFVLAAFQVSDGIQAVGAGVLRGAGDTRFTFLANLVGHWVVGLPVAWWLGRVRGGGVVGLWWGLSVGLSCVAVALVLRFVLRVGAAPALPAAAPAQGPEA